MQQHSVATLLRLTRFCYRAPVRDYLPVWLTSHRRAYVSSLGLDTNMPPCTERGCMGKGRGVVVYALGLV